MTFADIRKMPTEIEVNGQRFHESCLRASAIVGKVVELLNDAVPAAAVLDIIDDLVSAVPCTLHGRGGRECSGSPL